MAKIKIEVDAFKCERCNHIWVPRIRGKTPETCPKCHSPYWNTPRRKSKKEKALGSNRLS